MSVRNTIFEALITRLGAVTVANGYATSVAVDGGGHPIVLRVIPHSEKLNVPAGKAIVAITDEGEIQPIRYYPASKLLLQTKYVIHAIIGGSAMGLVPTLAGNNWIADMRKLTRTLNATPSLLSANVRSVELEYFPGENVSEMNCFVVMTMSIIYWIDQTAP